MKLLENYTKKDYNDDYYFYGGNSEAYVKHSIIDRKTPDREILHTTTNKEVIAKLGKPNFKRNGDWEDVWVFDYNGDRFYYGKHEHEGTALGIYVKKADKTKNWAFEPIDYQLQEDKTIGKKFIDFEKELIKLIK